MKRILSGILCLIMTMGVLCGLSARAEGAPYVTHNFPAAMKVGDKLPVDTYYKIHNLIPNTEYSSEANFEDDNAAWESFYHPYSMGGGGTQTTDGEGTLTCPVRDFDAGSMDNVSDAYICGYGTFKVKVGYVPYGSEEWKEINDVTTITIEKPAITSNAPATIKSGSTLNLNTSLNNTALTNRKVADHLNANDSGEDDFYYSLFYIPSVEIIEGNDIVNQSNKDYTNTLNTSETLTFNKAGTVKLKVTYLTSFRTKVALSIFEDGILNTLNKEWEGNIYNPESIITINVTNEADTTTPKTAEAAPKAEEAAASISGRLLDSAGNPMKNVIVSLFSDPIYTSTDSKGNFTIKNAPVGTHTLRVFSTKSDFDKFAAGDTTIKPVAEIANVVVAKNAAGKLVTTIDGTTASAGQIFNLKVGADGKITVEAAANPDTGDITPIFMMLLTGGFALCLILGKKRRYN